LNVAFNQRQKGKAGSEYCAKTFLRMTFPAIFYFKQQQKDRDDRKQNTEGIPVRFRKDMAKKLDNKRFVYADNSATTKVHPEVKQAMMPFFEELYGNPSSLHQKGREANAQLDIARQTVATVLGCTPNEIYFTSGGTESDNWAIKGAVAAYFAKNKTNTTHIITTKIEHPAVMNTFEALEKQGISVTYLDVDQYGLVNPDDVIAALRPETCLVSIMYANNEVGTIEPIKEIAEKLKDKKVLFFTDAVQAVGNLPIDVKELGVDMLSLSGHKIHAPKGIGALYIKKGVNIKNIIDGGGQERNHRSGTENLSFIVGLAKALELAKENLSQTKRRTALRDRLINGVLKIPESSLTGHPTQRLPGHTSFIFKYIEGESLLLLLDMAGICGSTGSACSSKSLDPSHVLLAIGLPHEIAHGSLRLSLSDETTEEDVDYIIENVTRVVERLRKMSPLC